jgi:hypothetical protein
VGKGGRRAVATLAPQLRAEFGCAFCVANGENMAGGGGLTRKCLDELWLCRAVDVVTSGDHVWDQKEFVEEIKSAPNVLRPANLPAQQPGRGWALYTAADGTPVGVVNLLGRVFMPFSSDCPFRAADRALEELAPKAKVILVDIHAEATSEKIAMARHLDGRASLVFGTHTHVPTADEQVLPHGTGMICDVGMVGARESVLGRAIAPVLRRFVTGMPGHFTVVEHGTRLQGLVAEIDPRTGKALTLTRVVRDLPDGSL